MRFVKENPEHGTERIMIRFLWWPKTINGETRWLETTSWREEWVRGSRVSACGDFWKGREWIGV